MTDHSEKNSMGAQAARRVDEIRPSDGKHVKDVGTFAAGQSIEGRYTELTTAPEGNFAEGQKDELDEAERPDQTDARERISQRR